MNVQSDMVKHSALSHHIASLKHSILASKTVHSLYELMALTEDI